MSGTEVAEGDVGEGDPGATAREPRGLLADRVLRPAVRGAAPMLSDVGRGARLPGRVLRLLSLVPVCVCTGWVLASFPLAAAGVFRPVVVIPVAVLGAAAMLWLGLALPYRPATGRIPWWTVATSAVIAVGFGMFTALTHSEHVIPRRDSGSYIQIAYWLAHHHTLTSPYPAAAFGPAPGDLSFGSPAFYEHGTALVPQFMTGWPVMLATVDWIGGWGGMLVLPAVIGGCAILAFAGLAARLVGPRWAPLAALLLAGAWPVMRVTQSTYSEPVALLVLAGASCLLIDLVAALRTPDGRGPAGALAAAGGAPAGRLRRHFWNRSQSALVTRHAIAAGLVLAGGELVRLDFGIDVALALPLLAGLWLASGRAARPVLAGLVVGGGLGAFDAAFVTRPYVNVNWSSVRLMLAALVAMAVLSAAGALVARRFGRAMWCSRGWRAVPVAGACLVVVVALGLFVRRYVTVDHSTTDAGVRQFTETAQRRLGLPVDGSRGYTEQTLWWVSWYLGWPLLVAAFAGAAALAARILRGRDLAWAVVLPVYFGAATLTLIRPGITPDHPWADRRLVVEVLPVMVLCATWALARGYAWAVPASAVLAARLRTRGARGARSASRLAALPRIAAVAVVVAFVVPIGIAAAPVAADRTELGELAAVARVCGALHPGDSVVLLDELWTPAIRAQCHVPVARLVDPTSADLDRVTASIRTAGRTPVVASAQIDEMNRLGLHPSVVVDLHTRQDQQQLIHRPRGTDPLVIQFLMVRD